VDSFSGHGVHCRPLDLTITTTRRAICRIIGHEGRSQEFATGDKKEGLGMEVRGPWAKPRWESGAKSPEAGDKC